jgi:hypothetical protein
VSAFPGEAQAGIQGEMKTLLLIVGILIATAGGVITYRSYCTLRAESEARDY